MDKMQYNKINSVKDAEKIVLEHRPNMRVVKTVEEDNYYVVSVVPSEGYTEKMGMFIGGATRVDKKTGKVRIYNPMLEGIRP